MAGLSSLTVRLRDELGAQKVIDDRQELRTYECDGLAQYRSCPGLVVLAGTTADVAAVVRACAEAGVPFVARGSGTGLSGGALPHADGVLIVTSRMRTVLEVDRDGQRAVVEPGVINLQRHPGRGPGRLLLRARPVQPADLLDRRQRRGELRRRALPEVRLHHQPRARRRVRRPVTATVVELGGKAPGRPRLRPARGDRRLRGHARHRDQGRPCG